MFKGITNLGAMLKQAQQIGGQMNKMTEDLKNRRAVGSAGGGMVEIEVNGLMEVQRCKIDPSLISQGDVEFLEDLVAGAISQAIAKGKLLHQDAMRELTGGFSLPGMEEAMGKFLGTAGAEKLEENDKKEEV